MKPNLKHSKQSVKLPSIGNRTLGDMLTSQLKQKDRPLSSKNTVNDLQKRLFSQLDAYDKKSSTTKNSRKSISKKQQFTKPSTLISSMKQINNQSNPFSLGPQLFSGMQKLSELMPGLVNKLKKYEQDNLPLKETLRAGNIDGNKINTLITEVKSFEQNTTKSSNNNLKPNNTNTVSSISHHRSQSTTNKQSLPKKTIPTKSSKPQEFDVETFGDDQINKIFQQYLQQQNMTDFPSYNELQGMSKELNKHEVDIEQLEKSMSNMIKQLGNLYLNQMEDPI